MDKRVETLSKAVADIRDGSVVMIGGFGGSGSPIELIHALIDRFLSTGALSNWRGASATDPGGPAILMLR
jgi:3-oxoadipate CoA-transferase, alpha subunit